MRETLRRPLPFDNCPRIPAHLIGTPEEPVALGDGVLEAVRLRAVALGFRRVPKTHANFAKLLGGLGRIASDLDLVPEDVGKYSTLGPKARRKRAAQMIVSRKSADVTLASFLEKTLLFAHRETGLVSLIGWIRDETFDTPDLFVEQFTARAEAVAPFDVEVNIRRPWWFLAQFALTLEICQPGASIISSFEHGLCSPRAGALLEN